MVYGQWLRKSGYAPDDKPYFGTNPEKHKGEKFLVEFFVPKKSILLQNEAFIPI